MSEPINNTEAQSTVKQRADIIQGGVPLQKPPQFFSQSIAFTNTAVGRPLLDFCGAGVFMVKQIEVVVTTMTAAHVYVGDRVNQNLDFTAVAMGKTFEMADGTPFNANDIYVKVDANSGTLCITGFKV